MILKSCNSKNYTFYYVQKSFRTETGKCSTKNIERLGTIYDLRKRFGDKDPIGEAKKYVAELTAAEKESNKKVIVEYSPTVFIQKNEQRSYNGGYLFLQNIYYELGLDYICKKIEKKHKNKYNLSEILSHLLYTRLLYPGSKLSSLEDARKFLEQPEEDIHQVYRALSLLATEFNEIQADVYKRSLKLGKRDTSVVYYDLTNYFFEWEEEGGLVQYGRDSLWTEMAFLLRCASSRGTRRRPPRSSLWRRYSRTSSVCQSWWCVLTAVCHLTITARMTVSGPYTNVNG